MTKVPFQDLFKQYTSIKKPIDKAIKKTIDTSEFIRGKSVDSFEKNFSKKLNFKYCISCANGTDALYIALKALKIKPGDEVIVPAMSWISSSEVVTQAGGKVVFCDIDDNLLLDIDNIQKYFTKNTVGIIAVHLYGQALDMQRLKKIAQVKNLWIIEDCAQAHLAKFKGKYVGSFGKIATFSFYPGKNLGAMGDAGAILTNDKNLYNFSIKYARHGGIKKGIHEIEGINSRMDGIQAAILLEKLKHLDKWTTKRRIVANLYRKLLNDVQQVSCLSERDNCYDVYHLFVIKVSNRGELINYLYKKGIQTNINYPVSLPFLKAYSRLKHKKIDFPKAAYYQSKILSLPIYPEITENQIRYVCECIKQFYKTK